MALHPQTLDIMGPTCHVRAKFQCDMLKDAPANVWQELLMACLLSSQPVDPKNAQEAFKAVPQMMKVATQLPPKSQPLKPPSTSSVFFSAAFFPDGTF